MPNESSSPGQVHGTRGFSLLELLITVMLSGVVIAGLFGFFVSQSRVYGVQRELIDVRTTLRGAAVMITSDLMEASSTNGDLISIGPQSVTLRSAAASGVVCSHQTSGSPRRFGIQHLKGSFDGAGQDSVSVLDIEEGIWTMFEVTGAWNGESSWDPAPTGGDMPVCFWGDSTVVVPRPQAAVELDGDVAELDKVKVGAPLRSLRHVQYLLYDDEGRTWLGRRFGGSETERLTGPLLPETGLNLTYYASSGAVTTDPRMVARVRIDLRGESFGSVPGAAGRGEDDLIMDVYLRNN